MQRTLWLAGGDSNRTGSLFRPGDASEDGNRCAEPA